MPSRNSALCCPSSRAYCCHRTNSTVYACVPCNMEHKTTVPSQEEISGLWVTYMSDTDETVPGNHIM